MRGGGGEAAEVTYSQTKKTCYIKRLYESHRSGVALEMGVISRAHRIYESVA